MPTAAEFRSAASRLRAAADDCAAVADRMWSLGDAHGVAGGRLEPLVETALTANAVGAGTVGQRCDALADLCLERAAVCDAYAADLAAWSVAVDRWEDRRAAWRRAVDDGGVGLWPGPRPARPNPPASWVEVGS